MDFDGVGQLPEDEIEAEAEDGEESDYIEDDEQSETGSVISSSSSGISSLSSIPSTQSALLSQLECKNCKLRQKDVAMGCGHVICSICFDKMKEARKRDCAKIKGKKNREAQEEMLKCPLSDCGKSISDNVIRINFDN